MGLLIWLLVIILLVLYDPCVEHDVLSHLTPANSSLIDTRRKWGALLVVTFPHTFQTPQIPQPADGEVIKG
eukprot:1504280-Amphidinium_carterae.2